MLCNGDFNDFAPVSLFQSAKFIAFLRSLQPPSYHLLPYILYCYLILCFAC